MKKEMKYTIPEDIVEEVKAEVEADTNTEVEEVVEEKVKPEDSLKDAKVVNCRQLNMREQPKADAKILCVINESTPIKVDEAASTQDFYKVIMGRTEGYCMKKFIEVK